MKISNIGIVKIRHSLGGRHLEYDFNADSDKDGA